MDIGYCKDCGLLHNPEDGECLGCLLIKENKRLLRGNSDLVVELNDIKIENLTLRERMKGAKDHIDRLIEYYKKV